MVDENNNTIKGGEDEKVGIPAIAVLSFSFGLFGSLRLFSLIYSGMIENIPPYTSCLLASIGLILGIIALKTIDKNNQLRKGREWAYGGILLSSIVILVVVIRVL